jgi:hypothetical protein
LITPSAEQVRTLAPDASAARAGEALADIRRWSGIGRSEAAAWGLCQGSGSSPYQAAVDLAGPAYKCSCPSRKIPCKHALGLMFLLAAGKVGDGQPPDWAATWLESRAARAAAATRPAQAARPAEADPQARARRLEAREKKVAAGIEELDRWLGDLMRRGLDSTRSEGYRFWDAMGARMVDAQATGLGRSVRALGWAATAGETWPHLLLEGSARLHLLCAAYRRTAELPEPLRADVRSLVGWTTKEEDLEGGDEVEDRWLVVGRRVDDTGQVITARTFLLGEVSGRFALHLAFGVDTAPPTALAMPGQAFRATLVFYPSATPLRATVRPMIVPDGEVLSIPGAEGLEQTVARHAQRLALNPFLDTWPVALREVVPVLHGGDGGRLLAREEDGAALPLVPASVGPRLLAVTGGRSATVIGEWDGSALRPMSVVQDARLVPIDGDGGRPEFGRDGDPEWSALLSAALLGTERIGTTVPVPAAAAGVVAEHDSEHSILAAAGVLTVRRRAGRRPASDPDPPPDPAPDDPRPALAGEAARLFGMVVAENQALLPEALALVRASRRRVPDESLPDLLALAASDRDLRSPIAEVSGPRAAWLAGLVPELAEGTAPALGPDRNGAWEAAWETAWETARGAKQRSALMRAMRAADPSAAREALAGWLPDLAGDERAAVLEALLEGLGPDDEPILATALADRRADVRRGAADLLVRLDGSALARLVESRARPLLATKGRLRPTLAVTLPTLDGELEAAGFGGRAGAGLGERAWLLRQLIAHTRPSRWTEWLAADASTLASLAAGADERRPVLEGWIEAAERFADPAWVRALVADPRVAAAAQLDPVRSVDALPPAQRIDVAAAVAGSVEPPTLARLATACPPPWPPALADAVLDALRKLGKAQNPEQAYYDLIRAAALGLAPNRADDLLALADREGNVRPALAGAIERIHLRARIHEAFDTLPALDTPSESRPANQPEVAR